MRFRPCIDIHGGEVKQIVGGTLGSDTQSLVTNFTAAQPSGYFAERYRDDGLTGGHVVMLGASPENREAALAALRAYPGGLQVGGGITAENASEFIEAGASHVIVTSYVFHGGVVDRERLAALVAAVGRRRLVLDLSCRRLPGEGSVGYRVVTDRWQKWTELEVSQQTLVELAEHCDEFLVHGVDVEGLQSGIEDHEEKAIVVQTRERHGTNATMSQSRVLVVNLYARQKYSSFDLVIDMEISPPCGFEGVEKTWTVPHTITTPWLGDCLSDIAHRGYRLQSSSGNVCTGSAQYIFVSDDGALQAYQLQQRLEALGLQLERQAAIQKAEKASWVQKQCQLDKEIAQLQAQVKAGSCGAMARETESAAKISELEGLREQMLADNAALGVKFQELKEQLMAQHEEELRSLNSQVAMVAKERDTFKEQLSLVQSFAPPTQEYEEPGVGDTPAAKCVRLACPGILEDQIEIEPIPNGVSVRFRGEDESLLYSRDFQYHHNEGRFELCFQECSLHCGVLLLVLKPFKQSKLRLGRVSRSLLLPIEEHREVSPRDDSGTGIALPSRSPSQASLGTTVSSKWLVPNSNTGSERSWAVLQPTHAHFEDSAPAPMVMSSPEAVSPGRCLMKDAFLLAEDGVAIAISDLAKGSRLCSLRCGDDGSLTFGVASVRAVRVGMLRDNDVAEIRLKSADDAHAGSNGSFSISLTSSHRLLACTDISGGSEWLARVPGDLWKCGDQLFVMQSDELGPLTQVSPEVQAVSQKVQTCEVVELELEDTAQAVLLRIRDGTFVAVFGSPGWNATQVVAKNDFLDVEEMTSDADAKRSSLSDPTHSRLERPATVYRQIRRPHDTHCAAWCKFHFTASGCKKGQLCTLCHDAEHEWDAARCKSHRGVHKKR